MARIASQLRVLNFHGIGNPGRPLGPGEADYWIGVDRFCDILDHIVGHPDRQQIAITFDDGNVSDLTIAAPELLRRNLSAEFFVLTGRLGKAGFLTSDDVIALAAAGMRIGSHGVGHRDWSGLRRHELHDELSLSKAVLEEICCEAIDSAAIPFGRYNSAVLAAIRKAGYTAAYSSDGGSMDRFAFLRPRTSIRLDTTNAELNRILDGRLPPLRRLRRALAMSVKIWGSERAV